MITEETNLENKQIQLSRFNSKSLKSTYLLHKIYVTKGFFGFNILCLRCVVQRYCAPTLSCFIYSSQSGKKKKKKNSVKLQNYCTKRKHCSRFRPITWIKSMKFSFVLISRPLYTCTEASSARVERWSSYGHRVPLLEFLTNSWYIGWINEKPFWWARKRWPSPSL